MIHSFLRSIGFREMKKSSDVYELLEEIINHPDIQQAEVDQNGNTFIECKKNLEMELESPYVVIISIIQSFTCNIIIRICWEHRILPGSRWRLNGTQRRNLMQGFVMM